MFYGTRRTITALTRPRNLDLYTAQIVRYLPTFRENLSVPSSRAQQSKTLCKISKERRPHLNHGGCLKPRIPQLVHILSWINPINIL